MARGSFPAGFFSGNFRKRERQEVISSNLPIGKCQHPHIMNNFTFAILRKPSKN